jgi:hypothetical protein
MKKTWQRNTEAIKAKALEKREKAQVRAQIAIKTLLRQGESVNFHTVAKTGQVSISWLYREPKLCEQIKRYREQGTAKRLALKKQPHSKDSMIATLKQRIKTLEQENQDLHTAIEKLYGENLILQTQCETCPHLIINNNR